MTSPATNARRLAADTCRLFRTDRVAAIKTAHEGLKAAERASREHPCSTSHVFAVSAWRRACEQLKKRSTARDCALALGV